MKSKIILWGTGERAERFIKKNYFSECTIISFVDTYKKENSFMGYNIISPSKLKETIEQIDYLVIVNQYFGEILELCIELGVEWDKIIITDNVCEPLYHNRFIQLKKVSKELFNILVKSPIKLIKTNEFDYRDENRVMGTGKYCNTTYMEDYFRYKTFEFVAKELLAANVEGEVAELGVFRGTFSSLINEIFKYRKLYLFDTFEGFAEWETKREMSMNRCDDDFISGHKNTSVKYMLNNLSYPDKAIVCQGFFPDSITENISKEKFAFVSLDVDFEESTYEGLKFFYPRLSDGGIIFVHDYNSFSLDGVKGAIKKFEDDYKIRLKKIPLADRAGTLVIIK